ncbi:MAG: HD domain-containing protein [Firmicutes bacterium]|nr:HD domain-containing protein [Bacillota bacterium]
MATAYYFTAFLLSLFIAAVYMFIWHKHFDAHVTLVFTLIPVVNLGYAFIASSTTLGEAIMGMKISYIGGSFLQLFLTWAVFSLCDIRLSRWIRMAMLLLSSGVYLSVLSVGRTPLFYSAVSGEIVNGAMVLRKEYGPMHTVFQAMLVIYFLMSLGAILYSYLRKNQVSRKLLLLLFLPETFVLLSYFGGRLIFHDIELIPAAYDISICIYLIISYRISLYDITDMAIDSMVEKGDTGFISVDFKYNYLGSNVTAREFFPALNELTVDRPLDRSEWMRGNMIPWLDDFKADEKKNEAYCGIDGKIYLAELRYLFDGRRKRGYQLFVSDDTRNQEYIRLINGYNTKLQEEVAEKTAHIVEMHDKLVMSMAAMVESRDNSTGGHIKRTSDGVKILIGELKKEGTFDLSDEFCRDIIKAAPMHDLGKIAVDDVILRKPGRYTPEEYEKMKIHAAEGARIVHTILEGTEDETFHHIAENVAHYHHERWDGSGYPEGLRGEEIPLEARIMAIADVYDALVSRRVYKESMSFRQADAIIMEGMGKQFDEALKPCYIAARPKLEAYYSGLETF